MLIKFHSFLDFHPALHTAGLIFHRILYQFLVLRILMAGMFHEHFFGTELKAYILNPSHLITKIFAIYRNSENVKYIPHVLFIPKAGLLQSSLIIPLKYGYWLLGNLLPPAASYFAL